MLAPPPVTRQDHSNSTRSASPEPNDAKRTMGSSGLVLHSESTGQDWTMTSYDYRVIRRHR